MINALYLKPYVNLNFMGLKGETGRIYMATTDQQSKVGFIREFAK